MVVNSPVGGDKHVNSSTEKLQNIEAAASQMEERSSIKKLQDPLKNINKSEAKRLGFMEKVFVASGLPYKAAVRMIPGDGNCLFYAVAAGLWYLLHGNHVLFNDSAFVDLSQSLRQLAVDTLEDSSRDILILEGDEIIERSHLLQSASLKYRASSGDYCRSMRRNFEWGGGPEIVALCNAMQCPIILYEPKKDGIIESVEQRCNYTRITEATSENLSKQQQHIGNEEISRNFVSFGQEKLSKSDLRKSLSDFFCKFVLVESSETKRENVDNVGICCDENFIEAVGFFGWPVFNNAESIHLLFLENCNHFNVIFPC